MAAEIISGANISKVYATATGPLVALDDVSFGIEEGEFISLVGPSGCGKSTLLSILGGLEARSLGGLTIAGEKAGKPRSDVGMMFQTSVLFPWRTIRENVRLPGQVLGLDKRQQAARTEELLDMVGLNGFGDRFPGELSGGMRQRVGLARLLAHDPRILMMDEPFGALDEFTRETMNLELLNIWEKTRKTVIFVTHNIGEAVFLSDRVFVMTPRPGRLEGIVEIDLPRPRTTEVMRDPRYSELVFEIRRMLGVDH
ncbi:ABC transporter ATP-binding protein [Xinfangfangia sp. D13-10-4-6]|uniref:ABC transporter ATP-binding protein n=1 Tax=Pseudogemmobacter hezensis TaxID=2737662 RepID=UPI0015579D25|nr:ABC transporter ATP-binding protein [Pseudogemmobacter hezensis]NPD17459.1 ABC transporter ATP-binding protein [Pseudogemmobacter hezensis]